MNTDFQPGTKPAQAEASANGSRPTQIFRKDALELAPSKSAKTCVNLSDKK
jgi:hypothetical protein